MRKFSLLVSAIFLLGCFGGEAIAADKGKPPSGAQKKPDSQDTTAKPEKKGGGGFAVKVGKKGAGSRGDSWEKASHQKDPF